MGGQGRSTLRKMRELSPLSRMERLKQVPTSDDMDLKLSLRLDVEPIDKYERSELVI